MSEEELFFEGKAAGKAPHFFGPNPGIDFFRSHCEQVTEPNRTVISDYRLRRRMIGEVVQRMKRLVREYTVTASRVGVRPDAALLGTVFDALQRESCGEADPLNVLLRNDATEQFLVESLYRELLEVPVLASLSESGGNASTLSSEDWRGCLDLVSDSISNL